MEALQSLDPKKDQNYDDMLECIKAQGPHKIYQAWEELDIEGQRPTTMRFHTYGLDKIITPTSTVLDLGSNVGFMSLKCAETARAVWGVCACWPFNVNNLNILRH